MYTDFNDEDLESYLKLRRNYRLLPGGFIMQKVTPLTWSHHSLTSLYIWRYRQNKHCQSMNRIMTR